MLTSTQRAQQAVLPLKTAMYHAAHSHKGGIGAFAGAYGFNQNTMQHKLNLNNEGRHILTVPEFEALLSYTRDPRLMDSLCSIYGNACWMDLSGIDQLTHTNMFMQVGELAQRVGTMTKDIAEALADGIVTRDELDVLRKDASLLHQTVQGIIARATAMMEQ